MTDEKTYANFHIVYTNDKYLLVYFCNELANFYHIRHAWILSRDRNVGQNNLEYLKTIMSFMTETDILEDNFADFDKLQCPLEITK